MAAPYDKHSATPHRCLIFVMNRWPVIKSKVHDVKSKVHDIKSKVHDIKSKVLSVSIARDQIKLVCYQIKGVTSTY